MNNLEGIDLKNGLINFNYILNTQIKPLNNVYMHTSTLLTTKKKNDANM